MVDWKNINDFRWLVSASDQSLASNVKRCSLIMQFAYFMGEKVGAILRWMARVAESDELFTGLRNAWRSREGRNLARQELRDIEISGLSFDEVSRRRPALIEVERICNSSKHSLYLSWRDEWQKVGADDASRGTFRGGKFALREYEDGWMSKMQHLREAGYNHPKNDHLYDLLLQRYR